MILVTAATGHVGGELVNQLLAAGEKVRAFTRNAQRARDALPAGVEIAQGDLSTGAGLEAALRGVGGVFLFLDATRQQTGQAGPAAGIIAEAGTEYVVALSSASAGGDPANIIAQGHIAAETALRRAGLDATVLRPGEFMSNALEWAVAVRSGDAVRIPFADHPGAPVDPADLAAIAVAALRKPGLAGRVLHVSGGEYTTPRERVRTLGRVLGCEVAVEEVSEADYVEQMSRYTPPFVIEAVLDLLHQGREKGTRAADWLLPTVQAVTGQPPRTFEEWSLAHAGAFH